MATINDPTVAANILRVGSAAQQSAHIANYPIPIGTAGGHFRLAMTSGTLAAALAANSELFQFRYITAAARVGLIWTVEISAAANVAATAAALAVFRMSVARDWTVAGSGGTRAVLTGDNQQLRTAYSPSEVSDAGISSTGALTAGTKTFDAAAVQSQDFGAVSVGIGTGALTTTPNFSLLPLTRLLDATNGGMAPLVLVNQEGFVIRTGVNAFPATMTWSFSVNVTWSEVEAF